MKRIREYLRKRKVSRHIRKTLESSLRDYSTIDEKWGVVSVSHYSVDSKGGVFEVRIVVDMMGLAIGSRGKRVRKLSSYLSQFYGVEIRVLFTESL